MMWTFVLSKLDGTEVGEVVNAKERKLSLGINRVSTANFRVRADHPLVSNLFGEDTLLKVYHNGTLRFHGYTVSTELTAGEGNTIQVNAANPVWKLSRRLLGLNSGGDTYTGDKAKSSYKMINKLNTDTATYPTNPNTGIALLSEGSYTAVSGTYVAGPFRSALTCINDLAHTLTGFDYYVAPQEYSSGKIGIWEAKQNFGTTQNAVFEYGGKGANNVKTMNFVRDLNDLTNKAFHIPEDLATEAFLQANDEPSLLARGRFEAVADAFGITDTGLREAWLGEVIRVKKNPRFVVSMTLQRDTGTGRVPVLGTDYWVGDYVTARGSINGAQLFAGKVRVYAVEIDIAESGAATITPVLLDEEGTEL